MVFPVPKYKSTNEISERIEIAKAKVKRPTILGKLQKSSDSMKKKTEISKKKTEWLTNLHSIRKERFIKILFFHFLILFL